MKQSRLVFLWFTLAAVVIGAGWLVNSIGHARKPGTQDAEKSLDIKRYPDEPLKLVDLKISDNSLKGGIKVKSRNSVNHWGIDSVKFKENAGWFRHVKIKLRNVSGNPLYGISVELYFRHPSSETLFGLALTQAGISKRGPVQPGEEIDLEVSERLFSQTMQNMKQAGLDPEECSISLSIDRVVFNPDFVWSRGVFLKRDPNNPHKWDAVDQTGASWSQSVDAAGWLHTCYLQNGI